MDFRNEPELMRALVARMSEKLMTAREVAEHLRITTDHLANLRRRARGPAWIETGTGAIRYRMSDVAFAEVCGARGVITPSRVILAIAGCEAAPLDARGLIADHVRAVLTPKA